MFIEHSNATPNVHPTAYVAPGSILSGDVAVGPHCRILFGAVLTAEGGPVTIGEQSVVMEQAVVRGTLRHPVLVGSRNLIGPHAYLSGCETEEDVFIAAGAKIYNGARLGRRSEVRINGVVHVNTEVPAATTIPIGWVAVGRPAQILAPNEHDRIWGIQKTLDFPKTVFGLDRPRQDDTLMPELTERYTRALAKHFEDRILD